MGERTGKPVQRQDRYARNQTLRISNAPHNPVPASVPAPKEEPSAPSVQDAASASCSRSRSRSEPMALNVSMPHNIEEASSGQTVEAQVFDRPAIGGKPGDILWQAKITLVQGGQHAGGRVRNIDISAPPRREREQAESDARQLTDMSSQGIKAVRALANQMHKEVHTHMNQNAR